MRVIRTAVTIVIMFCFSACTFREGIITNDEVARQRLSWLQIELLLYHEKNKTYPATLREMNSNVEGGAGHYDPEDLKGIIESGVADGYLFRYERSPLNAEGTAPGYNIHVRPLEFGKTGTWSFFSTEATGAHGTREDRPAGTSDPQGISIPRV
ncbi:MAG TPA: hypothetical protein VFR18_06335 [Terriglobia bacterium]|nr:hypothetical protein [Terriglobia bacterium]